MKVIVTLGFILFSSVLKAQEPLDAIRYSWLTPQGTARTQSIGGAITALGGDITALYTNPAGLGMYKTSELVLSPGYSFSNNKTSYRGSTATDAKSSFNYGPIGVVWGIPSYKNSKWKNVSIGLALSKTANFKNQILTEGKNNQSSFSEKYLDQLFNNGSPVSLHSAENDFPSSASLAYWTFLVDTVADANGNIAGYFSNASVSTGLNQRQTITTSGGISDFSIGLGANYNDKFYIGGSININTLTFTRTSIFHESDATNNPNNNFNYFDAEEYLKTDGVGASVKLGIIFKPVDALRVGINFHSPSWYSFKDTYTGTITADTEGYAGVHTKNSTDLTNGYPGEYNYRYRTPMRIGAGLAYIFGAESDVKAQKGFLSADVEYVSYKGSSFNAQDKSNQDDLSYFSKLNSTIDKVFKSALNLRIGGELKFETLMLRAGFGYYGNPYTNNYFDNKTQDITKGSRMNISGGLGWRNKGVFVDLAYIHQIIRDAYYPYRIDVNEYNVSKVNSTVGNIILTIGFKF
ncbi:MAG: outer membrane protein transport protein [Bacteroidetes bacterium]|nr:outer membrane protein transport protein [Bacteroidota bacterium]